MKSSIIRMGSAFALALFFVLLVASSASHGQVPRTINYQGSLTDSAGAPVTGSVTMTFKLYNALGATTALWTETRVVTVTKGIFSVVFGEITANPLQDSFFEAPLYLGIAAGGDAEMTPRQALTSAPQAIRAKTAENVFPAGAIMLFDLNACPTGWSEILTARGRALVGMPGGGTRGGTVGTSLSNLQNRAHRHDVDPAQFQSGAGGGHNHSVDPVAQATGFRSDHVHSANPIATNSFSSAHNHQWSEFTSLEQWKSFTQFGALTTMIDWNNGISDVGSGQYPISLGSTSSSPRRFYTENHSHSHVTDIARFQTTQSGGHNHSVDLASTLTGVHSGHTHIVNVANTRSTAAGTAEVMPYIQFLVCRKD